MTKTSNKGVLVLVRHGESLFNKLNLFTGWLDVPLTEAGIQEAHKVAAHCKQFDYDAAFTSNLERAHETLLIVLASQQKIAVFQHDNHDWYGMIKNEPTIIDKPILPVYSSAALNERAYGALQGLNKELASMTYGVSQVLEWRRGYDARPPGGESLEDVYSRVIPYICDVIIPRLERGETNLIVSHGNTLRAIIKFMENIESSKIPRISLPFASPLVYEYEAGRFNKVEGEYEFNRN